MRRRVSAIFSIISLALCIGLIVLWPRTTRLSEGGQFQTQAGSIYAFGTHPNGVGFITGQRMLPGADFKPGLFGLGQGLRFFRMDWARIVVASFDHPDRRWWEFHASSAPWKKLWYEGQDQWSDTMHSVHWALPAHYRLGFGWEASIIRTYFVVPLWFLISLSLILPGRWLQLHMRHRRRLRLGLCPECAYDLRASFDKCPECGCSIPANLVRGAIQ